MATYPGPVAEPAQIVDFVIWLLFQRCTSHKPLHLLCHGFHRAARANHANQADNVPISSVPGLVERSPNCHVRTLKEPVWCRLHALLGRGGDRMIMNLLLECALFCPVSGGTGNFYQLSGVPVPDLKPDQKLPHQGEITKVAKAPNLTQCVEERSASTITFVRSRMLYAKAALNAKGGVRFGMRHIRTYLTVSKPTMTNYLSRRPESLHEEN